MPYVSILIPAYNAASVLVSAYQSLVHQTIDDWEAIIVDDASTDDTLSVARSLAAVDHRVKVVELPVNSGPAYARNSALGVAKGEWIAILDADDRFSPDRLESLTRAAKLNEADVVLDNQFVFDPISGETLFLAFIPREDPIVVLEFVDFLENTQANAVFEFGYLKPLIKRQWLLDRQIRYIAELRMGEDTRLILDCYLNGARVILDSSPRYYYSAQFSQRTGVKSPHTRTEARYAPLIAATERLIERHYKSLLQRERQLLVSHCEYLREVMLVASVRDLARRKQIIGLCGAMWHPIRLIRGIYGEKRRSLLRRRRMG